MMSSLHLIVYNYADAIKQKLLRAGSALHKVS